MSAPLVNLTSSVLRGPSGGSTRVRGAQFLQDVINTKIPLTNLKKIDIFFGGRIKAASTR